MSGGVPLGAVERGHRRRRSMGPRLVALRLARLLALALAMSGSSLAAQHDPRLLPAPRELVRVETPRRFEATITFPTLRTEADREAAREFVETMRERGIRAEVGSPARGWPVALHREGSAEARDILRRLGVPFDSAMRAEGYVLAVGADGAVVVAASDAGTFYAL
ncbi:MAG: glycoside hydrolase family 20 zincin-like fold domain-containing protein, partial [Gemmatimonadota bacterium]|nr:glycoside hydrolase family 20 zincin-like fold domain-containing protein [Gemmatimonadota bacterium]MDQ8148073.1 glycoside hydrolase family 20 zincin-like fold domain-containing protein [Gemmatimonadota bacterium]MDQ8149724.1 glycoside hydrolase family 20 zincin-like fold domain-containing protein [Gemmatimonadota bacterium]MDQ8177335.1 glycoside hydrolase family 20 zincin-like fold domain-containing protein [Gemmatimonadota bacterium]